MNIKRMFCLTEDQELALEDVENTGTYKRVCKGTLPMSSYTLWLKNVKDKKALRWKLTGLLAIFVVVLLIFAIALKKFTLEFVRDAFLAALVLYAPVNVIRWLWHKTYHHIILIATVYFAYLAIIMKIGQWYWAGLVLLMPCVIDVIWTLCRLIYYELKCDENGYCKKKSAKPV